MSTRNTAIFINGGAGRVVCSIPALEKFHEENVYIDLGSDQTSLHNPWAGGYYPIDLSFEEFEHQPNILEVLEGNNIHKYLI